MVKNLEKKNAELREKTSKNTENFLKRKKN